MLFVRISSEEFLRWNKAVMATQSEIDFPSIALKI